MCARAQNMARLLVGHVSGTEHSDSCWVSFIGDGTFRAMTELKTDSALLRAERRDTVKLLIVLALVIISLIACMIGLPS